MTRSKYNHFAFLYSVNVVALFLHESDLSS